MASKGTRSPDEKAFDVAVGARIRRYRQAQGLNQADVARAVEVTAQQFQKYENGRNRIAVSRLVAIAAALDIAPAQLLEDGEEPAWATTPFSAEELQLLSDFRRCAPAGRRAMKRLAALLSATENVAA